MRPTLAAGARSRYVLPMARYDGPPMTLGNMRALGVRNVTIECACGREATMLVDALPDGLAVPEVRRRLRCSRCGARPRSTRPCWGAYYIP